MSSTAKVHVGYIIGILVAIIIVLLTVKWTDVPNLYNYLNFGLTLTSLVLAMLAIVYAFFSNASLTQHVGVLRRASTAVRHSTISLAESTSALEERVRTLPDLFSEVSEKVSATQTLVQEMAKSNAETQTPAEATPTRTTTLDTKALLELVVKRASPAGLLALYAAGRAAERGGPFDIREMVNVTEFSNYQYVYGFLIGMHACSVLSLNRGPGGSETVNRFDTASLPMLRKKYLDLLGQRSKDVGAELPSYLGPVDAYFDRPKSAEPPKVAPLTVPSPPEPAQS